jgi:hypothetical protein
VNLHILPDEQLKQEGKPGNQQKNVDVDRKDKKLRKSWQKTVIPGDPENLDPIWLDHVFAAAIPEQCFAGT